MDDKEELLEAIDNYSLFTPKCRLILKALINLAIDNIAVITAKELGEICHVSKPIVYKALELFNDKQMIIIKRRKNSKLSEFVLNPSKFEEIIKYHKRNIEVKNTFISSIKIT